MQAVAQCELDGDNLITLGCGRPGLLQGPFDFRQRFFSRDVRQVRTHHLIRYPRRMARPTTILPKEQLPSRRHIPGYRVLTRRGCAKAVKRREPVQVRPA